MLKITNDGRKLALEQRLINPLLPDNEHSKVNACLENVIRIYEENKDKNQRNLSFVICQHRQKHHQLLLKV